MSVGVGSLTPGWAERMLDAARLLDEAARLGPDDRFGRLAADLAAQARGLAAPLVPVPEPSRIRPGLPPEAVRG